MITDKNCDIFEQNVDVIIHQANCQCTMGSGIAKELRARWPVVYDVDCLTKSGDWNKMGTTSVANLPKNVMNVSYVINCYSQFFYGRDRRHTNYESFVTCLENVKRFVDAINSVSKGKIKSIAAPFRMGCNLAGGDWRIVRPMFDVVFENSDFDVVLCKKEESKSDESAIKEYFTESDSK